VANLLNQDYSPTQEDPPDMTARQQQLTMPPSAATGPVTTPGCR
jgi:hypothetical protein